MTRVVKEVERFSLCDVELVESEVEGGLVGVSLPSSVKCGFCDLCDSGGDFEDVPGKV